LIEPDQPTLCREGTNVDIGEIAKEKQRIGEALARADAQREKLTGQLSELEATERVLARYSKGTQTKRRPQPRRRARQRTPRLQCDHVGAGAPQPEKPAGGKRSSSSLGDQVLALAAGKTQQEIAAACKGARANHVGAAISRHTQSAATEQRAVV
jgi:hypothetical protein